MVKKALLKGLFLLFVGFLLLNFVGTAWAREKQANNKKQNNNPEVVYIPEKKLPRKVFVFLPLAVQGVQLDQTFGKMLRSTIQNYLSGKGYIVKYADRPPEWTKHVTLKDFDPKKIASKLRKQDIDGFFIIKVYKFSGINIVLLKKYVIDAALCLYNNEGKKLACWREDVSRRKLDIATDPLGFAAKVIGGIFSDSKETKMKVLVYDWSYQVAALIPGFSAALKKPKIFRVFSNVTTDKVFKMGDKIVVAIEGDPGLKASFDIGTFKQGLRAIETSKPGIYEGVYLVQKGDETTGQYLLVRLENEQGEVREWLELTPSINIDGIPPAPPAGVSFEINNKQVKLFWTCKDATTKNFVIFKSQKPLAGYKEIAHVADVTFIDKDVKPGQNYYYRIAALDDAGNLSEKVQVGPVQIPVSGLSLKGPLPASLSQGSYHVKGDIIVPTGHKTELAPGVILIFNKDARLVIQGSLVAKGSLLKPKGDSWRGIEITASGSLEGTQVKILKATKSILVRGKLLFKDSNIYDGKVGIFVTDLASVTLDSVKISGCQQAIVVDGGEIVLKYSNLENNQIGILLNKGDLSLNRVNFLNNKINIKSSMPLVVHACYLGTDYTNFKLLGPITITSYLNLPYPQGKEVPFDQKALEKKAREWLEEGKKFVREGNYGKACERLEKAYKILKNDQVYYWLVYVYTMLDEDKKLSNIIQEALDKFPYEVKIYQLAVRYYLFKGKVSQAEQIVDRALKLQPNNPTLQSLKNLIEIQKESSSKNSEKEGKDETH